MIGLLLAVWMQIDLPKRDEPLFLDYTRTKINAIIRHDGCLTWGLAEDKLSLVCYEPRYVDVWTIDQTQIRIDRLTNTSTVVKKGRSK